jgi:DNA helicase-2/ATP-dependent DNA helicase PcrA
MSRFAHLNLPEQVKSNPILKHPKLTDDGLMFFKHFYDFIKSIRNVKQPQTMLIKLINTPLYEAIIEMLANQRAKLKSGEIDKDRKLLAKERIARKARLLSDLASHYKDVAHFVNAMVLGGNELSEGDGVNLLTVHASKGLEFTEVYITDLMDGRFPNTKLISKGGSIEEERRLFYVAVTRAKERLYLSLAKSDRVKKIEFTPSPFLYEAGLLKYTDN